MRRLTAWLRAHRPSARGRALLLGVIGALLAVQLFSAVSFSLDAFTLRLDLTLVDSGETIVRLPPFGRVEAKTHAGPVGIDLTLVALDIDRLRHLVATSTRFVQTARLLQQLERMAALFTARVLVLALAGGVALPLLAGERDWRRLRGAALLGVAVVGGAVLLTWGTYRTAALRQPRYVGALQAAPWLMGLLDTTFHQAKDFENQLPSVADGLYGMFTTIQDLKPVARENGWRTVMLVSDIHNNPAAYVLMRRLAASFHPDFVVDAGDLTDFGTDVETAPLKTEIPSLHLPYLITPGNHETPYEIGVLRRIPGVVILDGQEVVEDGVPVVGIADPSSRDTLPTVMPPAVLAEWAGRLAADVEAAAVPPTIVVAHNPSVIEPLAGMAPVLFNGHTHTIWVRRVAGGVWLDDGTTGAGGIRGLTTQRGVPYSLMMLYIATDHGRQYARAVETIRLTEVTGTLDVTQQVFPPPPPPAGMALAWRSQHPFRPGR